MSKIVTLKNGEEIYKVSFITFNKNNAEIWRTGEDTPIVIPMNNISSIA